MSTGFILRAYLIDGELLQERQFAALPIRIGRNALNDFSITEGIISRMLSNFHARIEPAEDKILLRDVGSKNGIFVREPSGQMLRIQPDAPVDLAAHHFEFFLGPQLRCQLFTGEMGADLPRESARGAVLGNADMLMAPGLAVHQPAALSPLPAALNPPPATLTPPPAMPPGALPGLPPLPPLPGAGPHAPAGIPGGALPPLPGAQAPPQQYQAAGGGWAPAPNAPQFAEPPTAALNKTGHFANLPLEGLALQGLRELAASLVPGKELRTAGDLARFITKLHDSIEVFCRCFIPLREGYAQFVSSLDLQRAAMQRSMYRSRAYMAVEMARDPESLAGALLDWTNESVDAHKAIDGIYADLMIHQVALLDGVMQGVKALLDELSPDNLEQNVGRSKLGVGLSGRYKTLWQSYCDRFEQLSEEKQAFSHIFGHDFTEAYREYRRKRQSG